MTFHRPQKISDIEISKSAVAQVNELWKNMEERFKWEDFEKEKLINIWVPKNLPIGPVPATNNFLFKRLKHPRRMLNTLGVDSI